MALTSFEIGRRGPYANMGMWLMAEPEGVSTAVMAILAPLPVLRPAQHYPGCLHGQHQQVAIAARRESAGGWSVAGRDLLRH